MGSRGLNPDGRKRIVHIDTQPAEIDAAYLPEVQLVGDIDGTLRRLLAAVLPRGIGGRDAGARHLSKEILVHADLRTELLRELEQHAAAAGARAVRLETNRALVEAIQLYRSSGYEEVPAFNDEPYAHHWFEKRLGRAGAGAR